MEVTIVEIEVGEDEVAVSRAYMDGYIDIDSADALRFEREFDALIKKYAR